MALEIERKFLMANDLWKDGIYRKYAIKQGYLNSDIEKIVRVRIKGSQGYITIKGATKNITRVEYEYKIPLEDAEKLLLLCEKPIIEKLRHEVLFDGKIWEIDEFFGKNSGLILAEIELKSKDEVINIPSWIGKEVSNDARFYNSNLAKQPYTIWS